jgi:hypothetical protein
MTDPNEVDTNEVDRWLIFLNDEHLFWTEQEDFANFNDVAEEERANCEILKNVEGFTGPQLVRLIIDGSGNKIPEVYDRPPPQLPSV